MTSKLLAAINKSNLASNFDVKAKIAQLFAYPQAESLVK